MPQAPRKTLLLILDGWGIAPDGPGNCVSLASTPFLDSLKEKYPHAELACSGRAVGLPDGFMGNSEVGHMNIGAGRVVYQDMTRIDIAIENGSFFENPALVDLMNKTKASTGRLHLMGLVSDGGVHSHQNHIYALLEMAKRFEMPEVYVHAFLDGRDTPPRSGKGYVEQLEAKMAEIGIGKVATVAGRYWAMDRDSRYERNEEAWKALVEGSGVAMASALDGIQTAYDKDETDEFVKPGIVAGVDGKISDGDGLFFFNFRADRARQISRAFYQAEFEHFARPVLPKLACFNIMTRYESTFPNDVAFPPVSYNKTLGEVVSGLGLKQLRIAETEKYAHVTYFMNCGREDAFPGEDWVLVPSPRDVATYDLKPEMSANIVAEQLIAKMPNYDLCICNLANLDMVGHTGIIEAANQACQVVDACVEGIVAAALEDGRDVLLTADHGNAEEMIGPDGGPQTAHSTNPVPLYYISNDPEACALSNGKLGDLAPTILDLWNVDKPAEMTGESLVRRK